MKLGAPIYVKWVDSHSTAEGTWHTKGQINNDPAYAETIGWVLKESKRSITLVSSISPEEFGGDMTIPKGAILKRKKIRL